MLQLSFRNLPAWYKSALFNELYFVSDGGTVWLDPMEGNSQVSTHPLVKEYSKFAYLEGKKCDWQFGDGVCSAVESDWQFGDGVCNAGECDWL